MALSNDEIERRLAILEQFTSPVALITQKKVPADTEGIVGERRLIEVAGNYYHYVKTNSGWKKSQLT